MSRVDHNKLIRDKVPESLMRQGSAFKCSIIDGDKKLSALIELFSKESKEIIDLASHFQEIYKPVDGAPARRKNLIRSLAEMHTIMDEIERVCSISRNEVETERDFENKELGTFRDGHFLEWTES